MPSVQDSQLPPGSLTLVEEITEKLAVEFHGTVARSVIRGRVLETMLDLRDALPRSDLRDVTAIVATFRLTAFEEDAPHDKETAA
jgi:hypothetical protein